MKFFLVVQALLVHHDLREFGSHYAIIVFFRRLVVVLDQVRGGFTRCAHPREQLRGSLLFLFTFDTDIIVVECEAASGTLRIQLKPHIWPLFDLATVGLTSVVLILRRSVALALALALVLQDGGATARGVNLA